MNKKLLVIIVVYNGIKWLNKCIESVENSNIDSDLFIIDNGSTDGSIDFINNKILSKERFIISKENLGFGKANNLGLKYAIKYDYDFVYLLNQDAWVEKDTFKKLIEASLNNSTYGILSPIQINGNKTSIDSNFINYCPKKLISDYLLNKNLQSLYETDFVMAAHWLIPTDVIRKVGGFSPTFTHYGEDNNYIHRIKYWNLKVGILPNCYGIHDRENRIISKNKLALIAEMNWRYILSDPNTTKKFKLKKYIKSMAFYLYKIPILCIRRTIKILFEIKYINENLKASKQIGAFLK